jgi:hypothetical protein
VGSVTDPNGRILGFLDRVSRHMKRNTREVLAIRTRRTDGHELLPEALKDSAQGT